MIVSPHAAPSPRPLQAPILHSSVRTSTTGYRDAESLFMWKPIAEIRNAEAATRKQIEDTKEELRPFVGNLIDSVDSIVPLKASCTSISTTIAEIHGGIRSLSASSLSQSQSQTESRTKLRSESPAWTYGIACRVKYLVDTLGSISGYLDEEMYFEAALRVVIAKYVHRQLFSAEEGDGVGDDRKTKILANFPLLQHQWQIVDMFWQQISRQSRERLLDRGLAIAAYADALAAVAVIYELQPKQVLSLFLESMNSWILQVLGNAGAGDASSSVMCDVLGIIQVSVCQLDELFFKGFNDMPLFYKVILGSPTASQLFARIPNPDEEVRLWKSFQDKLESTMVMLDEKYIAGFTWLRECVKKISERNLIDATGNGRDLASGEKSREILGSKHVLERNLVLKDDSNLRDEIFEEAFLGWMKAIIDFRFRELTVSVDVVNSISTVGNSFANPNDVQGYLNRPSMAGGVWFVESNSRKTGVASGFKVQPEESELQTYLNAYFGPEVCQIWDAVDFMPENS